MTAHLADVTEHLGGIIVRSGGSSAIGHHQIALCQRAGYGCPQKLRIIGYHRIPPHAGAPAGKKRCEHIGIDVTDRSGRQLIRRIHNFISGGDHGNPWLRCDSNPLCSDRKSGGYLGRTDDSPRRQHRFPGHDIFANFTNMMSLKHRRVKFNTSVPYRHQFFHDHAIRPRRQCVTGVHGHRRSGLQRFAGGCNGKNDRLLRRSVLCIHRTNSKSIHRRTCIMRHRTQGHYRLGDYSSQRIHNIDFFHRAGFQPPRTFESFVPTFCSFFPGQIQHFGTHRSTPCQFPWTRSVSIRTSTISPACISLCPAFAYTIPCARVITVIRPDLAGSGRASISSPLGSS